MYHRCAINVPIESCETCETVLEDALMLILLVMFSSNGDVQVEDFMISSHCGV